MEAVKLTLQKIFDRVAEHLLAQDERSYLDGSKSCAYRGAGGLKCAVGCLIPDSAYDLTIEGKVPQCWEARPGEIADSDVEDFQRRKALFMALDAGGVDLTDWPTVDLLLELQEVHDHGLVENWPILLLPVADKFNLTVDAVRA